MLRDPVARLVTALINLQRPNEGLKLAEERLLPGEAAALDSVKGIGPAFTAMAAVAAASRLIYGMARDHGLPKALAR